MTDFKPNTIKVKNGSWTTFAGLCKGCGICLVKCPQKGLFFSKIKGVYNTPVPSVDPDKCTSCGICELNCPDTAIRLDKQA